MILCWLRQLRCYSSSPGDECNCINRVRVFPPHQLGWNRAGSDVRSASTYVVVCSDWQCWPYFQSRGGGIPLALWAETDWWGMNFGGGRRFSSVQSFKVVKTLTHLCVMFIIDWSLQGAVGACHMSPLLLLPGIILTTEKVIAGLCVLYYCAVLWCLFFNTQLARCTLLCNLKK